MPALLFARYINLFTYFYLLTKGGRGNEEQDNGSDRGHDTIGVACSRDVGATGRHSDGPANASVATVSKALGRRIHA